MSIVKNFGMPMDALANAARVRPPTGAAGSGFTETATVADTASAAIATGVATTGPGHYAFACNAKFMIAFGTSSTITNPTNSEVLQAGVHHFYLTTDITHYKVTATEAGYITHWKSSYGNE